MNLNVTRAVEILAEIAAIDEKRADRGPIKIIPRPSGEAPDHPSLIERQQHLLGQLHVKRNYTKAKGHDLDAAGDPVKGFTASAIGIVEAVQAVEKGADRANKDSAVIVMVGFPDGSHMWFDPGDLEEVPAA